MNCILLRYCRFLHEWLDEKQAQEQNDSDNTERIGSRFSLDPFTCVCRAEEAFPLLELEEGVLHEERKRRFLYGAEWWSRADRAEPK